MVARPRIRRSRLASWSWWLALLTLPALVAAILAHRWGNIDTPTFYVALGACFVLAIIAFSTAATAIETIWRDGRSGFGVATRGLILSAVLLALPAHAAWQVMSLPRLNEVSTDLSDPPPLFFEARAASSPGAAATQLAAYPDLLPRRYPDPPPVIFAEAQKLIRNHGWRAIDAVRPGLGGEGRIAAVALTPIFAFREDVAIRFRADGAGTRVDMRSASRHGAHDMGSNAYRVRRFLDDLDAAVSALEAGAAAVR